MKIEQRYWCSTCMGCTVESRRKR